MTVQEAGNHKKWIKALEERIGKKHVKNCDLHEGQAILNAHSGSFALNFRVYKSLNVYIYFFNGRTYTAEIFPTGVVENSDNHPVYKIETMFQFDTEGISLLIETLRRKKEATPESCVEAIKEAEALYAHKFRGIIQGDKFGF